MNLHFREQKKKRTKKENFMPKGQLKLKAKSLEENKSSNNTRAFFWIF